MSFGDIQIFSVLEDSVGEVDVSCNYQKKIAFGAKCANDGSRGTAGNHHVTRREIQRADCVE
jgi:hypothetical protein